MTPTIVTLQEVLDNHPTLSPGVRAFCESLLTQGDMLAVTADYFPLSLREAQDLLTTVGDTAPATVYEAAARLLAPPPEERP